MSIPSHIKTDHVIDPISLRFLFNNIVPSVPTYYKPSLFAVFSMKFVYAFLFSRMC
jgi:hypothetical protein